MISKWLLGMLCGVCFWNISICALAEEGEIDTDEIVVLSDSEPINQGWQQIDGGWYYYNDVGEMQTGWLEADDNWYLLDSNGTMQTGWQVSGNDWYYLETNGEMQTGWKYLDNHWYYFGESGGMQTGWRYIDGFWYYMETNGEMQTGWIVPDGTWYYLRDNGAAMTGWLTSNGTWYYFDDNANMAFGWRLIGDIWYYFNENGEMQTDWQIVGASWYYFGTSGDMKTGWLNLNSNWYYLTDSGSMQIGWGFIDNTWYYFNGSGEMQTGWLLLGNAWYYLNSSGEMQTGWYWIGSQWYYFDENGVMLADGPSGPGKVIFKTGNIMKMNSCLASNYSGNQMTITLHVSRNASLEGLSSKFYIVLLNSDGTVLEDASGGNVSLGSDFQISARFTSNDYFRAMMMGKYAVAVKVNDTYQVISELSFVENPEITVSTDSDMKDKYWGYYEGYKITSKKGIQGVDEAYTEDLRVQHVLLNVDIQDLVSVGPSSGYIPYTYKNKTYYFSDLIALRKTIRDLHGWGSSDGNAYGENHTRAVTLVLLMSWKYDSLSYLIHPDARVKGAAPYYALNMKEKSARETFEALFCYMGEMLGQPKERVSNWTLGNEVNSCNAWNYSGKMSLTACVENYAQAFQLLNQAVKRTANSPRLFISLDHCWNIAEAGFKGKDFLNQFATYMNQTSPSMQWNVNYHPYAQPLNNSAFWKDFSNTKDSTDTKYISMRNIQVLTDYLASLEVYYGKPSNSIRVILGEVGYSATGGNSSAETLQAAALGYGYYIAMFNHRIDAYIIRAYLDEKQEVASKLYLGLRRSDSNQTEKQSYAVYKYLDTNESLSYMNRYLNTIGISGWQNAISGFDANSLKAKDF